MLPKLWVLGMLTDIMRRPCWSSAALNVMLEVTAVTYKMSAAHHMEAMWTKQPEACSLQSMPQVQAETAEHWRAMLYCIATTQNTVSSRHGQQACFINTHNQSPASLMVAHLIRRSNA
jgi:hypothetical protein